MERGDVVGTERGSFLKYSRLRHVQKRVIGKGNGWESGGRDKISEPKMAKTCEWRMMTILSVLSILYQFDRSAVAGPD